MVPRLTTPTPPLLKQHWLLALSKLTQIRLWPPLAAREANLPSTLLEEVKLYFSRKCHRKGQFA